MFSGWQPTFDTVLHALHEGAGRMAGDVDPLHPFFEGQAEPSLFPFRSIVGALQPEQIFQPRADALVIAVGTLIV